MATYCLLTFYGILCALVIFRSETVLDVKNNDIKKAHSSKHLINRKGYFPCPFCLTGYGCNVKGAFLVKMAVLLLQI